MVTLSAMTRRTEASSFCANAESLAAWAVRAVVIAGAVDEVAVRMMSPPAATNRTARSPAGIAATDLAAPRSSEMTTPPYPRVPRSSPEMTAGENTAALAGSIFG